MNRSIIPAVCASVLLNCAQVFGTSWDTVVFRDDFDSSLAGMPDPNTWVVNHLAQAARPVGVWQDFDRSAVGGMLAAFARSWIGLGLGLCDNHQIRRRLLS